MGRQRYSAEFKESALKRIAESTTTAVARELGVSEATLTSWKFQARKKSKQPEAIESSSVTELQNEVRDLRAENRRLQLERDILKKATAFFANENN
jgi:transposase